MRNSTRKKLTPLGRNTRLPVVGDTVIGICVSANHAPEVILADASGHESVVELFDRFSIGRGTEMMIVHHDRPSMMSPLLELVGASVTEATAFADGRLELSFSNSLRIEITSTTGYEAWHFQYPRPGRPPGGDTSNHLSTSGAHGRLE